MAILYMIIGGIITYYTISIVDVVKTFIEMNKEDKEIQKGGFN